MQRQGTLKGPEAPTFLRGAQDGVTSNVLIGGAVLSILLGVVGVNDMTFGWNVSATRAPAQLAL